MTALVRRIGAELRDMWRSDDYWMYMVLPAGMGLFALGACMPYGGYPIPVALWLTVAPFCAVSLILAIIWSAARKRAAKQAEEASRWQARFTTGFSVQRRSPAVWPLSCWAPSSSSWVWISSRTGPTRSFGRRGGIATVVVMVGVALLWIADG